MAGKQQGLITAAGKAVPLKDIDVSVIINGFVSDVQSVSRYVNEEESPIEAVYVFPVDDQSAVYKFEADIDGRHLIAECHERTKAREIYDDAIFSGKIAMYLEEDDSAGDIFRCKLGNLPSKADANLSMGIVTELDVESDGRVKFILPTILNPRYFPDIGSTKALEGTWHVPPVTTPYNLKFQLTIKGTQVIKDIIGPVDKFDIEYTDERRVAKVSLAETFKFDHDLCVLVEYEDCNEPQIIFEKGNPESAGLLKEDVLMVNFFLKAPAESPTTFPGEFIFIIDRSGSMEGNKMENARKALLLFLKSLPVDCYFNVIGFGSGYESLFPAGSQIYNEENLNRALELQKCMSANLGGTEILAPLQHVYNQKPIDNYPRQLFVLTDGEVGNVAQVVQLAKRNSGHTRVFTVGIGQGASTALVRGLAEGGRGKEIFVTDTECLQSKVISLLQCAMQPDATDLEIKWELPPPVTNVMMPPTPRNIFLRERQIFYVLLSGTNTVDPSHICSMTLKGKLKSIPFEYKQTFTFQTKKEAGTPLSIHRLAAKAQIKDLQLNMAANERIIMVSKAANVISKHTAFVMVDEMGQITQGAEINRWLPRHSIQTKSRGLSSMIMLNCLPQRRFANQPVYESSVISSSLDIGASMENSSETFDQLNAIDYSGLEEITCDSASPPPADRKNILQSREEMVASEFMLPKVRRRYQAKSTTLGKGRMEGMKEFKKSAIVLSKFVESLQAWASTTPGDSANVDIRKILLQASSDLNIGQLCFSADDDGSSGLQLGPEESHGGGVCKIERMSQNHSRISYSTMMEVIRLQTFSGSWDLSHELLGFIGMKAEVLKGSFPLQDDAVVATFTVIAWLRKHFSGRRNEWQMLEAKALNWLKGQELHGYSVEELILQVTV